MKYVWGVSNIDERLCVYVGSGMMWGSLFIMFERRNEKMR